MAWDLSVLGLAWGLVSRGATPSAVGWLIVTGLSLVVTGWVFWRRLSARAEADLAEPSSAVPSSASGDLVEVMQSTDVVEVEVLRGKLAANGIAAEIVGQHASRMLGYLPVVPLRLMVPRADVRLALDILAGKGAN